MKRFLIYIFIFPALSLLAQNHYYKFSALEGFTGQNGDISLFYRLNYTDSQSLPPDYENSIYHLNLTTGSDTLFLRDFQSGELAQRVNSVRYWNGNPSQYIHCGAKIGIAVTGYIQRYDQQQPFITLSPVSGITISRTNDSLLYAWDPLMRSTDGGRSWTTVNTNINIISVSPFNTNLILARDSSGNMIRSTDGGISFTIVDTNKSIQDFPAHYSPDGTGIFVIRQNVNGYKLFASGSSGAAFSWTTIFESQSPIIFAHRENENGRFYVAAGSKIYTNGASLNSLILYRELPRSIKGLFAPVSTGFLYAATTHSILKVNQDTIITVKSLTPDPALFSYFPLEINNKWFYTVTEWDWSIPPVYREYTRKVFVEKDTVMGAAGKSYKKVVSVPYTFGSINNYYRIDSLSGLLFSIAPSYQEEFPIHDFLTEPGDTIPLTFTGMLNEITKTVFDSVYSLTLSGNNYLIKSYHDIFTLLSYEQELANNLGIIRYRYGYDFGSTTGTLRGAVINGVVFGDTTFTGIEDEAPLPDDYSLSQNYPNPFNPSTTISYHLPAASSVTLTLFDILGRKVATIIDRVQEAGNHRITINTADTRTFSDLNELPSGVYFYRLQAGEFSSTRKMTLLK